MSWIKMIDESQAEGLLAELYERTINREKGRVGHIVKIHSLNPKALGAFVDLLRAVAYARSGVQRYQREMIATVVSAINAAILNLTQVAALFAYLNRIADALGIRLEADAAALATALGVPARRFPPREAAQ